MNSLPERLNHLLELKGITPYALAQKTGISEATLSRLLRSVSAKPNMKTMTKLAKYFRTTEDWLLTGSGEMLKEGILISKDKTRKSTPYWDLKVTAGRTLGDVIGKHKPDGFISNLPGADMAENIFPVVGFSMEPEIQNGAFIGVQLMSSRWEALNTSRIYLIITRDDRMIKRIEHDDEDKDILWCISPNYKKFKIFKEDIIEIHKVCFVYNQV